MYRITGNFGGGFNLAFWRSKNQMPNYHLFCHARMHNSHAYTIAKLNIFQGPILAKLKPHQIFLLHVCPHE
jgi:hypothetical protein